MDDLSAVRPGYYRTRRLMPAAGLGEGWNGLRGSREGEPGPRERPGGW